MHSENATLLRRLGAMLYDSLLVGLGVLPAVTLVFVAIYKGEPVTPGDAVYQAALLAAMFLFFVLFWSRYGRTLGMQAWRLRIETPDGRRPDIIVASMRFLAAVVSFLPAGLGFWWQLFDRDGLSWHDRISNTRVRYYPKPTSSDAADD